MVHASLIDVLLRFRRHKVAMTTDLGKMYRAILLKEEQWDLYRFLWKDDCTAFMWLPDNLTKIWCMCVIVCGQHGSEQNALDQQQEYPEVTNATLETFYIVDGLVGADNVGSAIILWEELQSLPFSLGVFELRKRKPSDRTVEHSSPQHLRDQQPSCLITYLGDFVKVFGDGMGHHHKHIQANGSYRLWAQKTY